MQLLGKNKSGYLYANFNNVLTIRWYFSYIGFLARCCTASECFRVLLKVIYLSRLNFKPVNFLQVCCPDDSSSWFFGYCNQNLWNPLTCVLLLFCMDNRFYPRIFGMFSKIAVFFGSNLSLTQRLTVYFLRSTGFSLPYVNFDNLLEIRCDQV